jgi:hypothetical protein
VAEAAAALGTNPEAVRQRAIGARRRPGNDGKARVLLDVDAQKDKAAPRKRRDVQPSDARTITTLEACIADLRSLLAKAEERAAEERNAVSSPSRRAARAFATPWWQRWRRANGA